MLKKSDLAKQFELVVQQEITNYNKSLNQILQTLNSLQEQINEIKEGQKKLSDIADSRHQETVSSISSFRAENDEDVKLLYTRTSDQAIVNNRNTAALNHIACEIDSKLAWVANVRENFSNIHDKIDKHGQTWKATYEYTQTRIDDIHAKCIKQIEKSKNEILNAPSDASLVRRDLEEKIYAHKVDVQGIMRELNIYKKEAYIVEKKLENIYTLIDRLQKGDK